MDRARIRGSGRSTRVGAAALLATLPLAVTPVAAHAEEGPDDRAITLVEPAAVLVSTSIRVEVTLEYADSEQVSGKSTYTSTYRTQFGTGSGFFINPSGTAVTASHVVEPEPADIRVYGANRMFRELLPKSDPFQRKSVFQRNQLENSYLDSLLQQCYDGRTCDFESATGVRVLVPVQTATGVTPKAYPARIVKSTGYDESDIAVLQIAGRSLPTAPLSPTVDDLKSGQQIAAVGFPGTTATRPGGTTEPAKVFGTISTLRPEGSGQVVETNFAGMSHGFSGGAAIDSAGKVIGLVSYASIDENTPAQIYLRTVDDIRAALRGENGLQAARGEVDALFGQAMTYYWGQHFSAALPLYQKVLNLYDGHPLARRYLAAAQAKAGSPADVPLSVPAARSDRRPWPLLATAAGVLALALIGTLVLLRRRRRRTLVDHGFQHVPPPSARADEPVETSVGQSPVGWDDVHWPSPRTEPPQIPPEPVDGGSAAWPRSVTTMSPPLSPPLTDAAPAEPPVRRFCSSCGVRWKDGAAFCGACGAPAD